MILPEQKRLIKVSIVEVCSSSGIIGPDNNSLFETNSTWMHAKRWKTAPKVLFLFILTSEDRNF